MPDVLLFIYAAAVGFFAAWLVASVRKAMTSEPVRFGVSGDTILAMSSSFLFGVLLGPVIIVRQAVASVRTGNIPASWAAAGVMLAVVWSCVLGIAILAVADTVRDSLA